MKYVNLAKNTEIKEKLQKKKKKRMPIAALVASLFILLIVSILLFGNSVKAIFDPISIISTVSKIDLKETDGRTNVVILGSDKRVKDSRTNTLTDTILVASIGRVEKDVLMLSLPRDLWVQNSKGYFTKINEVYSVSGGQEISSVVEGVLGIPIHYYAVVDFKVFTETVDNLGGIEVNVENAFSDRYYPVEGKEDAPFEERYETVSFEQGVQSMDGETALKFARSRKGDNNEGTDFARSARQQKVISAIKDKALSLNTLVDPTKLKNLYVTYESNIDTNMDLTNVQSFYLLSQEIDFDAVRSIVLDDRSAADEGGLLYAPQDRSLYGGAYVLLPKDGTFSQMHAYVQRYVFANE